jgi:ferredoxin
MRIVHDKDMCGLTGQCVATAPDVFDIRDDELVFEQEHDDSERGLIEHAVRLCPMQALGLEG